MVEKFPRHGWRRAPLGPSDNQKATRIEIARSEALPELVERHSSRSVGMTGKRAPADCFQVQGEHDYLLLFHSDSYNFACFHMSHLPDADGIPVTRVAENYIWFQKIALPSTYSQGKLDRLTGSLDFFHRRLNNAKDYYLRCKPAKPFDGPAL